MKRRSETISPLPLLETIAAFRRLTIAVWGDFVADEYLSGAIARVSREAPVLILKRDQRSFAPGGAGNAAANLAALGVRVRLAGPIGDDDAGSALREQFTGTMDLRGLLTVKGRCTPTKTRVLAHHAHTAPQQVVRIDHEPGPVPRPLVGDLLARARRAAQGADALLVSDYGYGGVWPAGAQAVRRGLRAPQLVTVDARYQIEAYRGFTAATPNEAELEAALGVELGERRGELDQAGRKLRQRLGCGVLLVTRGRDGMALWQSGQPLATLPVYGSDQALDVTGAGDTVIAVFTAALATGADALTAARLANYAGGIVVMKRGTATVTAPELKDAVARELGAA